MCRPSHLVTRILILLTLLHTLNSEKVQNFSCDWEILAKKIFVRRSSWTRRDTRSSSRPKRSPASSSLTWRSRTPSQSTTSSSPLGKLQSRKEKKMNGNFHSKTQDIFHSSGGRSRYGMEIPIHFWSFSIVMTSLSLRTGRLERTDHTITECCSAPVSPDPT